MSRFKAALGAVGLGVTLGLLVGVALLAVVYIAAMILVGL